MYGPRNEISITLCAIVILFTARYMLSQFHAKNMSDMKILSNEFNAKRVRFSNTAPRFQLVRHVWYMIIKRLQRPTCARRRTPMRAHPCVHASKCQVCMYRERHGVERDLCRWADKMISEVGDGECWYHPGYMDSK